MLALFFHMECNPFVTGDRKEISPMTILRRLRRLRLGGAVAFAATAAMVGSLTGAVPAASQTASFDLDHGNALVEVIYPTLNTEPRVEYFDRPGSWIADHAMLIEMPWFDALTPYHPTAVGIFSDLGRRPAEEHTTRNKNIAVIYAAFTSLNVVFPQYKSAWIRMMESAGLDPNNTTEDPATPSGIGILAAKNAYAARKHDGTNREGDEGGRQYNRQPYSDYTGYKPVNSAYELRNPSRWQPNTISRRDVYTIQGFATPQFGRVKPFSFDSPEQFQVPPPPNNYYLDRKGYRDQADEVLKASASLDDRQKMSAELFDGSLRPFGIAAHRIIDRLNTEDAVHFAVTTDVAAFDTAIASWYFMRKYDSVRPFSAIRQLYGEKKVTAWGGPGKGTVSDITGDEWRSYLSTLSTASASPGYPSVNTAVCLAYAQDARRFTGSDELDIYVPAPRGSSLVESGVTPASDMALHWSNFTDWASDCGKSRVWGGENFPSAIEAANQYGSQIGDLAYDFIQRKLNGG